MLGRFRSVTIDDVENVPVCADYCDFWFGACQNDLICVENWLDPANFAPDMLVTHFVRCMAVVKDCATGCGELLTVIQPLQITVQLWPLTTVAPTLISN